MATSAMPSPDQSGGAPQAGAPSPSPAGGAGGTPPSQGPANQIQQLLGNWSNVAQQISQAYPQIAGQMNKIVQAIGEAQTAMVSPPQPTPSAQNPPM